MSDFIYKKYEDGFEEYQAQIYNSNANKFNGKPVTVEEIKKRLEKHTPPQDRDGITYAFDVDMKPIAYIQYREYSLGKVRIGYPWSIEGTSIEVKDKLFYGLLDYLKAKYPDKKEFFLGFLNFIYKDVIDDLINHYGFVECTYFAIYEINFEEGKRNTLTSGI